MFFLFAQDKITESIEQLEDLKPEEKTELIELLDCHFDPEKTAMKPIVKQRSRKRSQRSPNGAYPTRNNSNGNNKENATPVVAVGGGGDGDGPAAPDSTQKLMPQSKMHNSGKHQRGRISSTTSHKSTPVAAQ